MSAALTKTEDRPSDPVSLILHYALDERIDGAKLQILWDLQKDILAEQRKEQAERARVAFFAALADVQRELPIIGRDAANPHTSSRYARLETIWEQCCPIWTKYGFAVTFDAKLANGLIDVSLRLSHKGGHIEIFHAPEAPPDSTGTRGTANKTLVQGNQSTVTYLKRGLLCSSLGIVTANEDDDGAGGAAPSTVIQRRGRDMPPVGRDDPVSYPPQSMRAEAQRVTEAQRRAAWIDKLRTALANAESAGEVTEISNRPSVKDALARWDLADRTAITEALTDAMERVSQVFEHPTEQDIADRVAEGEHDD